MDFKSEYNNIMARDNEIALATSVNNIPNVRVVNFIHQGNVLYFATFMDNQKISEFTKNNNVAFTTLKQAHVRVRNAIVSKSNKTIYDFKDEFINKIPGYDENIAAVGDMLVLFEINFDNATVTIDMENSGTVKF